jgi:protein SCO1/2
MKLVVLALIAAAQAASPLEGVGIDQKIGGQIPLDLVFRDEAGAPVSLRRAAAGKTFILAPVYYRCPQLCTLILNGLVTSLKGMGPRVGEDFQVVAFSFDPREDAALASSRKAACLKRYDRPGTEQGWRFLTGSSESIDALCGTIGYRATYDARTGLYAHSSAVIVVGPDGRIFRYFFGIEYSTRDLRLAVAEASAGKSGSLVDPVLLFCFQYDPATGRYGLAILRLIRGAGVLTVFVLGLSILGLARRRRRVK